MSRAEKYLPFAIAFVVPAVGLIKANLLLSDIEVSLLVINYLVISCILLALWYFNKWLHAKVDSSFAKEQKTLVVIGANAVLVASLGSLSAASLSESMNEAIPFWLIMIRLSIIVFIFNVILRVFQSYREKSKLELYNLSLQAENLKFQVETLKQQINPHFLFNSLNTLLDLVEDDKEKAIEYIRTFSSIYRTVLQSAKYDFVSLADELKFLLAYYNLLKVRFQEAVEVEIVISKEKEACWIPPLSLQFLVENAVKHNAASSKDPLVITISEKGNELTIRNKINLKRTVESEKLGLQNLQQRFSLLHQPIEWKTEGGFFIVKLPLKTA